MLDILRNLYGKSKVNGPSHPAPPAKPDSAAAMRQVDIALHNAVMEGDLQETLALCSQGADPNSLHTNGYSVLMHAVQAYKASPEKRIAIAKALLEQGANPFYASGSHQALTMAFDIEVVRLLMEAGVRITPDAASSLMYNFHGNREIRALLDNLEVKIEWNDSIRQLYARIREYTGDSLYADVLKEVIPLMRDNGLQEAEPYKQYNSKVPLDTDVEHYFYALHRVNEALLEHFQRSPDEGEPPGLTVEQYADFWERVGLTVWEPMEFHPFFCEIYQVHCRAEDTAPALLGSRWPCLLFGDLLFSRASVAVSAGADHLHKQTAEESTLYWSHLRADRKCEDLSMGWGSNSQWRTRFRFDYWSGDKLLYNVNHNDKNPYKPDEEGFPEQRRMELLKHRCCVRAPELPDCFPYDFFGEEVYIDRSLAMRPWSGGKDA